MARKVARNGGETVLALIADMNALAKTLKALPGDDMAALHGSVVEGAAVLRRATDWAVKNFAADIGATLAGASHYLRLMGYVAGNYLLAKAAAAAHRQLADREGDPTYLQAKIITARFFAETLLPQGLCLLGPMQSAGRTAMTLDEAQF